MKKAAPEVPGLRAGDWVEVRSKDEILGTLDKKAQLENRPFMPQMLEYCGRRLRVAKSAHKTCDTISKVPAGRRVSSAVHLEGVRCDGRAFDGCHAACSIFWKQAWLKRVDATAEPLPARPGPGCTIEEVMAATRAAGASDGQAPTYVCQATELGRASTLLPWWDIRQYVEDYRSRNVSLRQLAGGLAYAIVYALVRAGWWSRTGAGRILTWCYDRIQALRGGVPFPRRKGKIPSGQRTPTETLDLQPGELVYVKPYREILATLDTRNRNRGLYFDAEHVPYCGRTYRVRSRVNRIVDEKTGKLLEFKTGSVILEGVACQARYSDHRMFCPRAIYPYWREIWLQRVNPDPGAHAVRSGEPSEQEARLPDGRTHPR
jgi:hypothetical protein